MRSRGSTRLGASRSRRVALLVAALSSARVAGAVPPVPASVQRLSASGPQAGDGFGGAVAVDGNTLVVGNPGEDHAGSDEGAAYVFVRPAPGAAWTLAARLVASSPNPFADDESFGSSVAVSGDVVVVGAPLYDLVRASSDEGVAFVFVKPPGGWSGTLTESARLQASNPDPFHANEHVGISVAVEGDVVAVGADSYELAHAASDEGVVFVYRRPAGGWSGTRTEDARLQASVPNPFDGPEGLGHSVAIEGDLIVAGADLYDFAGPNSNEGAAFVFRQPLAGWSGLLTESARLQASVQNPFGHVVRLGRSVALSGDTVVVGADSYDLASASSDEGVAFVYVEPVGGWSGVRTETAQLRAAVPNPFDNDEFFGSAVSIEGNLAAVGARSYDLTGGGNQGAVFLFERPAAGWSGILSASPLSPPSGAATDDELGSSVALDGDTLVAGAPLADAPGAGDSGAAWAYTLVWPGTVPGLHGVGAALAASLLCGLGCRGLAAGARRRPHPDR